MNFFSDKKVGYSPNTFLTLYFSKFNLQSRENGLPTQLVPENVIHVKHELNY